MPEALATLKRKFYKYIDAPAAPTSARPSTPSTSTTSLSSHPSKRLRPSPSSLDPNSASAQILARIEARRTASSTSVRTNASFLSRSGTEKGNKDKDRGKEKEKEIPNFSPWSHETFLARLKTFAPVTLWHPKPDPVNEVEWAKRGWSCVGENTVCCRGGCGKRVVVRIEGGMRRRYVLQRAGKEDEAEGGEGGVNEVVAEAEADVDDEEAEDELNDNIERELVQRYKALLVEGHADGCLWRQAGCKNDIYRLPVVRPALWQPELRDRYRSLLAIAASFATVDLFPSDKDVQPSPERLLADFPGNLLAAPQLDDKVREAQSRPATPRLGSSSTNDGAVDAKTEAKALKIALCGWHGRTEASTALLSCNACFQRVGLWMYQPDYRHPFSTPQSKGGSNENDAEASEREGDAEVKDDNDDDRGLDLVEMHREHCPWRNGASQCGLGEYAGMPAWRILWRVVGRYADECRRRSRDRTSLVPLPAAQVDAAAAPATPTRLAAVARDGAESVRDEAVAGNVTGGDVDIERTDSVATNEHPELTREEISKQDKERISKLRRLKRVLGLKRKRPASVASSVQGAAL